MFAKCSRIEKDLGEIQVYHEELMEHHFEPREGFSINTGADPKTGDGADAVMVNRGRGNRATVFDLGTTLPTDLSGDWEKAVAGVESRKHETYSRWNVEPRDVIIIAMTTYGAWGKEGYAFFKNLAWVSSGAVKDDAARIMRSLRWEVAATLATWRGRAFAELNRINRTPGPGC